MPHRLHLPEGELDNKKLLKVCLVGIVQVTAVCVGILAVVYLTIGFGTWQPI